MCSGTATLSEWIMFYLLAVPLLIHYQISAIIALTLSCIIHYSLNKIITFKSKTNKISLQFSIFMSVVAIYYILTFIFMWIIVELCMINAVIAKIICTLMLSLYSFIMHSKITFNNKIFQKDVKV